MLVDMSPKPALRRDRAPTVPGTRLVAGLVGLVLAVTACTGGSGTVGTPAADIAVSATPQAPATDGARTPDARTDAPDTPTAGPTTEEQPDRAPAVVPGASTTPPPDAPGLGDEPGTVVVTDADATVSLVDPGTGDRAPGLGGGSGFSQATPSDDGGLLVATTTLRDDEGEVTPVLTVAGDGGTDTVAMPFGAYYHAVAPTGQAVASLGNAGPASVGLVVTDLAAGTATQVDDGRPYFFDWGPDGTELAVHVGTDVLGVVTTDGRRRLFAVTPGQFQAPAWTEDGRLVVVLGGGPAAVPVARSVAAPARTVQGQADGTLAVLDPQDGAATDLAPVDGPVAFDVAAGRVAWITGAPGGGATIGGLEVVDLDGGGRQRLADDDVVLVQWSPDGDRLLFAVADPAAGLVPHVWDGDTVTAYAPAVPSTTFFEQYLPFWAQYARSISLWAPDGSAFVMVDAGLGREATVVVQALDGARTDLGPGQMAVWSR